MVELRHHIAALVAIFLALGLGIMIGGMLTGQEIIAAKENELIKKIEEDFQYLRQQNEIYQRDMETRQAAIQSYQKFAEYIFPRLVQNRLAGKRISVIFCQGDNDEQLLAALQQAGADIVAKVSLFADPTRIDLSYLHKVMKTIYPSVNYKQAELKEKFYQAVGHLATNSLDRDTTDILNSTGLLKYEGKPDQAPEAVIIYQGNSGQKAGQAELLLARQLRQTGALVIAVEKTDTIPSRISYYRNLGISSVDNVDTVPGRLALVLLLEGSTGHYGIKPTASSLLPGNSLLLPGG